MGEGNIKKNKKPCLLISNFSPVFPEHKKIYKIYIPLILSEKSLKFKYLFKKLVYCDFSKLRLRHKFSKYFSFLLYYGGVKRIANKNIFLL